MPLISSRCGKSMVKHILFHSILPAFLLGSSLLHIADAAPTEMPTEPRPNVLFIAIDDLNDWTNRLGGYDGVKTPNLDRLAARGCLFTKAYCSAPACNPSRASLLCGIRPSTSGVYKNSNPWRNALPDAVTLPQLFIKHGYKVHGGGKIFHGRFKDPASWQQYVTRPADPLPQKRPANGIPKTAHFDWGPVEEGDNAMADTKIADWAGDFLGKKHDKPFFLAVGFFRPHLPWFAPKKYFDLYPLDTIRLPKVLEDDLDDVPHLGRRMSGGVDHRKVVSSNNWEKAVQGYLACITYTDGQIGRLLDALDESPHKNNTIIVLWSDHGWHLGEKKHWRKFALWEEATRVQLIVAAPGVTTANSECPRTVSLLDVYPTVADLCGLPVGEHLEGKSLVSLLKNPTAPRERPAITTYGRNNHAVRDERWRYIRYEDGTEELYDHDADPNEWENVAALPKNAKIKQRLAKWLPKKNVPEASRQRKRRVRKSKS